MQEERFFFALILPDVEKMPGVILASKRRYNMSYKIRTSESVTEGHADKVCDYIADSILDAYIAQDKYSRVAVEVLCKSNTIVLAGEVTSKKYVDLHKVVKQAMIDVGYDDSLAPFNAENFQLIQLLTPQDSEIAGALNTKSKKKNMQRAGDQGIMFGYATDETPELMPLPILLAHRLAQGLADDRKSRKKKYSWLRPDGKTQVSVVYDGDTPVRVSDVLVSTQHQEGKDRNDIREYVEGDLMPRALDDWHHDKIKVVVNPSQSFTHGGPASDSGLTGRKNIVDTYGGAAHHGGGSFSGKDPSKVDRSATYFCRYVARQIVLEGIAKRAEVQAAYAIGKVKPFSLSVNCFGTGDDREAYRFLKKFDFKPGAIIEKLNLLRPIYRQTTNYGHFGRAGLPWETNPNK
jgi:S-adenosylmethionine synthetase